MTVIHKKTLWEGKFLRSVLIKYNVRCNSSNVVEARDWEALERVNCDGVIGIVPFTEQGEVILIRQFRPPINGFVIELPAGLVDPGENFEQAVRRELIEETGYEAVDVQFLTEGPMSSGASSEILSVYIATGLKHVGIGQRDETEDIEVIPVLFSDVAAKLEELRQSGDHIDLKVYGMIEMAKNFLKNNKGQKTMKKVDLKVLAEKQNNEYVFGSADTGSHACYMIYGRLMPGEKGREIKPGKGHEEMLLSVRGSFSVTGDFEGIIEEGSAIHLSGEQLCHLENKGSSEAVYVIAGGHAEHGHHH